MCPSGSGWMDTFSEEKLDIPAKEKKTVEIEVLTSKTMLVPREVFDAKAAPALMRINGMEPTERECILISDPQQPVIALMAADKASVEKVRARLKEKIRWTSPVATYRGIHGILPLDIPL